MFRKKILNATARVLLACSVAVCTAAADFSGTAALEYTRKAIAFGQRPPGSAANQKLQAYIEAQLKPLHCQMSFDAFTAQTPVGAVPMRNIIAKFPGSSGRAIVITGHFDTKPMPGRVFLGANDGGSSTGFLLELAQVVNSTPHADDIYLVFFDGEEAFGEWSDTNGTFGSRHLADVWARQGMLSRIKALINVDMIGDKDLGILQETMSSGSLRRMVWKTAEDMGYRKYFLDFAQATEDDHLPFLRKGVNALDLIDFDYGPHNAYWHNEQDTMDKLSAHSFDVVGNVVAAVLRKL
ncbi:MAG TPA: M28 family peptidase [Bryobacteraceae bacterium]|nr:M28 family peptidase [Bryobacteraceae bacterium]